MKSIHWNSFDPRKFSVLLRKWLSCEHVHTQCYDVWRSNRSNSENNNSINGNNNNNNNHNNNNNNHNNNNNNHNNNNQ